MLINSNPVSSHFPPPCASLAYLLRSFCASLQANTFPLNVPLLLRANTRGMEEVSVGSLWRRSGSVWSRGMCQTGHMPPVAWKHIHMHTSGHTLIQRSQGFHHWGFRTTRLRLYLLNKQVSLWLVSSLPHFLFLHWRQNWKWWKSDCVFV